MTETAMAHPIALNDRAQGYITQLCTNLYVSVATPPKCLALTAADRKEGKTSIGLGLAIQLPKLFAARVVFVEGDLHDPAVGKLLALPDSQPGLADALVGRCSLDQALVDLGEGRPDVLTAGTNDDQTISTCLNRDDVGTLFSELAGRYEHIIVETPPINFCPEAQVLIGRADQVLLVIQAGTTSREAAALAVKRIELCGAPAPVLVLNRKKFHVPEFLYKRL